MRHATILLLTAILVIHGVAWSQSNILNNGGFESGLMCYGEWMTSQTGQDFAGDYQFLLSSDAHSGNYSLEMNCNGSDCVNAYIYSDLINSPANQTYQISLYSKCPAGVSTSLSVLLGPQGNGLLNVPLACNGNWSPNVFTFQTGSSASFLYFRIFLIGTQWLRLDDLLLTYGNGTVPQTTVLHPGFRNVSISGQTVLVDGAPFLSLGFFQVPYGALTQAAATGANTINGLPGFYAAANCFNDGQKTYLDTVYDLGMNFLPDSSTTARLQTPAVFPAAIQTFAPHLANIGWFLSDEPDLQSISMEYIPSQTFIAESSAAKTQTSLPMIADFQTAAYGPVSGVAPYNGSADIWMAEPYGTNFSSVNYAINLFNSIQARPIWLAQDDIDASLIVPKAYWAIIAGTTGIQYFNWDTFNADPTKLAAATEVFSELKGLKNAIFGQKLDALVAAPSGIASMSRFDSGTQSAYILSANSSGNTIQGKFQVQGLAPGQQVNVLYENRSLTASTGSFTDTFAGVSRHVYQIQNPTAGLTASLLSESGPAADRDWKIQVLDSGIGQASSAQITSVSLTQTGGAACTPQFISTFPLSLGNILPAASVVGDVLINFTGCDSTSKFTVRIAVSANSGAATATVVRNNERI